MAKQKTQYKHNPLLVEQGISFLEEINQLFDRWDGWVEILSTKLNKNAISSISNALAIHGYEPNEDGIPIEALPDQPKVDPLVILDGLEYRIGPNKDEIQDTLAWKCDLLEAAILVAAGCIDIYQENISDFFPQVYQPDVWVLLMYSDINQFCNRRGFSITPQEVREKFNKGERIILSNKVLADMLSRSRGGT